MPTLHSNEPPAAAPQPASHFDPETFDFRIYNWLHLVGLHSEEGARWAARIHRSPLIEGISQAETGIVLLRRGMLREGAAKIAALRQILEDLEASNSEISTSIGWRWVDGGEAYLHYLVGDYELARVSLDAAIEAVQRSIEECGLLTPVARAIIDLTTQRARVARNERKWSAMETYLASARAKNAGYEALIELSSGEEIFFQDVIDYCHRCEFTAEEHAAVDWYYQLDRRKLRYESETCRIVVPSGFVVPYL